MHSINVVDVEEYPLRPPEDARVVLDRFALGWGIHDAEHLLEMVMQQLPAAHGPLVVRIKQPCHTFVPSHLEVEHLVLLLHRGQEGVLGEVAGLGRVLLVGALDLLLERLVLCGSRPDSSKSRRSSLVKAEPLLKKGWFRRTVPLRAHSSGPLVLRGRCANLVDVFCPDIVLSLWATDWVDANVSELGT